MKSAALYELPSEFSCRSCGSKFLGVSPRGICIACDDSFRRWVRQIGSKDFSERVVNRWLARQLLLTAKRLERFGVIGRCEAVRRGPRGFLDHHVNAQCSHHATRMRDGRRVCGLHINSKNILYVGTSSADPYLDLQHTLTGLAKVDQRFLECLVAAAQPFLTAEIT